MNTKIKFGTDGWRAIIAEDFTFENLRIVSLALGRYLVAHKLNKKGIFIGYDNRFMSEDFALQVGYVLFSLGIEVYVGKETLPTPVTAFMVKELKLDGAVMITASHNPYKYNGIKFIPHYGGPASDEITEKIERELNKIIKNHDFVIELPDYDLYLKRIHWITDIKAYVDHILSIVDQKLISSASIKVVLDTMFGAGIKAFPMILQKKELNIRLKVLNNWRDTLFGNNLPDPSEKNLLNLKSQIAGGYGEIGIALDGDADRFGVIDGKGVYISPNNSIALILYYLLNKKQYGDKFKAVRSIATTHLIDKICKKYKVRIVETPVGFKYIGMQMLEKNVIIGGEESGGLSIIGHIPEKDGLLAGLLFIEIQAYLKVHFPGMHLSDYLESIYKEFGNYYNIRIDLKIPLDKKDLIIEYFKIHASEKILGEKVISVNDSSGIKLIMENESWFLIRPSGTEPLVRVYVEAKDLEYFNNLKIFINEEIKKIINN
jgi:alpha-D-glucose phosphate-specific phosphoglucomutase